MALHVGLTLFAFRALPCVPLLLTIASFYSDAIPRRVTIAWASLTATLIGYVAVLGWGPTIGTPKGLVIQALSQKTVALLIMFMIAYQIVETDRSTVDRKA